MATIRVRGGFFTEPRCPGCDIPMAWHEILDEDEGELGKMVVTWECEQIECRLGPGPREVPTEEVS